MNVLSARGSSTTRLRLIVGDGRSGLLLDLLVALGFEQITGRWLSLAIHCEPLFDVFECGFGEWRHTWRFVGWQQGWRFEDDWGASCQRDGGTDILHWDGLVGTWEVGRFATVVARRVCFDLSSPLLLLEHLLDLDPLGIGFRQSLNGRSDSIGARRY